MPEKDHQENKSIFPETENVDEEEPRGIKDQFLDRYYNLVPIGVINISWVVLSLPILTIFPALGGLYYAILEQEKENSVNWFTAWEGFKRYWKESLVWGLVVILVDVILAVSFWFYLNLEQTWAVIALVITVTAIVFWLAINQFSFPLLMMQKEKKVFLAIRNGYVIVLRQPLMALRVLLVNLLISVISTLLPPLWLFISMGLIGRIQTRAARKAIEQISEKDAERDAIEEHAHSSDGKGDNSGV